MSTNTDSGGKGNSTGRFREHSEQKHLKASRLARCGTVAKATITSATRSSKMNVAPWLR